MARGGKQLISVPLSGAAIALLAVLAPMKPAFPQTAEEAETRVIYRCTEKSSSNPSQYEGLKLRKIYLEDGSVDSFSVTWEGEKAGLIRTLSGNDRIKLIIEWPGYYAAGVMPIRSLLPFDAETGTITFQHSAIIGVQRKKHERWSQTVITRDHRHSSYESGAPYGRGDRLFSTDNSGLSLNSAFRGLDKNDGKNLPKSYSRFPVSSLLAWGHGVDWLTVYDTRLGPQPKGADKFANPPIWDQRIVLTYELGTKALAEVIDFAQAAVPRWEAETSDFRTQCAREIEEVVDIIVT